LISLNHLLQISHGRRTVDTLKDVAPHLDVESEARALEAAELTAREGIVAVGGGALCAPDFKQVEFSLL
jgi:alcohol dehydrogenase class IV